MPLVVKDCALLAAELVLYAAFLGVLFRLRATLGIGLFVTALGTLHFLETYLAAKLYVLGPLGFAVSPGSAILFSGKLMMLLLVYMKEDATTARQPIYGLFLGNLLIVGLVLVLRRHDPIALGSSGPPDLSFLDDMGWLMVWGTVLLYVDSILVVLVYERLGRRLRGHVGLRVWIAAALVLTLDQGAFFLGLKLIVGVPIEALYGGWFAKMAAAGAYAALTQVYVRFVEPDRRGRHVEHKLREVFEILTYRERYHAATDSAGRDALTGALSRGRLETQGRQSVDLAIASGQSISVFVLDLDGFKIVNDRYGHSAGDRALRALSDVLHREMISAGYVFRYGGDEFVICAAGLSPEDAVLTAERLAAAVRGEVVAGMPPLSVSVGVATGAHEGRTFAELFDLADSRLYASKRLGRKRASSHEEVARAAA